MKKLDRNSKHIVTFDLNGAEVEGYATPRMLLSDFLRHEIGATGTHVGCEHGICGACTVRINGKATRSCLMLAVQADGAEIRTIEGLSEPDGSFGKLQQAFHEKGGFRAMPGAPIPDLLSTATALHALAGLELSIGPAVEPTLDFVDTLWSGRAFYGHWAEDILDCEYTFYGLLALGHLALES